MTLNQVQKRIQDLCLSHKQIRTFRKGLVSDFFTDKTAQYPAACLQDNGANISLGTHQTSINYRLFLLDLVHVSEDTKTNEDDVLSDMLSIAMDLLAKFNQGIYDDWKISVDNNAEFLVEAENDMPGGVVMDFTVSFIFTQNVCQIPTE